MEGERGKLRQSLEELQRLHSQVSTLSSVRCREYARPSGLSGTLASFTPARLPEKWVSSDRSSEDGDLRLS